MSYSHLFSTEESEFSPDDETVELNSSSKKRKHDDRNSNFVKGSKLFEAKVLFNKEYFRDLEHVSW